MVPPQFLRGVITIPARVPESNTQLSAIRIQSDPVADTRLGLSVTALQTAKKERKKKPWFYDLAVKNYL